MKKTIALTLLSVFILSLVPLGFADNMEIGVDSRAEAKIHSEAQKGTFEDKLKLLEEQRIKLKIANAEKSEAIANLSEKRLQKIAELDKNQIERLSKLKIRNLEKITELKKERLERLSELNQDKIERLSELEKEDIDKVLDLNDTEVNKLASLNRARLKEMAKYDKAKLRVDLRNLRILKIKNADELNERNLSDDNLTQLKENLDDAKNKFETAKNEFDGAKKELKKALNDRNEERAKTNAKIALLKAADLLIFHLEKLKINVQANENIPSDEEARIVAQIDAKITQISSLKTEVNAATTKEQIKQLAKNLREIWNDVKDTVIDLNSDRVISARVEGLVNRAKVLEKRLDQILAKANESNVTVDVSAEISMFSERIANAEDKEKQAQAKLTEAINISGTNQTINKEKIKILRQDAHQLLMEANNFLKQAHEMLKLIVKKVREEFPKADLSSEVEVEIAQETHTDSADGSINETSQTNANLSSGAST